MLTTREQVIEAGLAVELTEGHKLVRPADDDPTTMKLMEARERIYVLSFRGGKIQLVQSGTYIEVTAGTFRHRLDIGKANPPQSPTPLLHAHWDGDPDYARHPTNTMGLNLGTDVGKLVVWSLEGILWAEGRPHRQRQATKAPLIPPQTLG